MKKFNKVLSLVMAIVLILGLLPAITPTKAETTGYGSNGKFLAPIDAPVAGSIAISTRAELEAIKNNLGGKYHLTNDIDLSGTNWIPIGTFNGVFDGQGYVIKNLNYTGTTFSPNYGNYGLFSRVSGATIMNVGMEDLSISNVNGDWRLSSGLYAGAVCGNALNSTINNCYNTGTVSLTGSYTSSSSGAGGICGFFQGSTKAIEMSNCYNTGTISAPASASGASGNNFYSGGLCGLLDSDEQAVFISNCYNSGSISATGGRTANAGGLFGEISTATRNAETAKITKCFNIGIVNASAATYPFVGGICGNISGLFYINNSYNRGNVTATASEENYTTAGGLCGQFDYPKIENCYNVGQIIATGLNPHIGGILGGFDGNVSISRCYCLNRYDVARGTVLTVDQMKDSPNFVGFDFTNVWDISDTENSGYPFLRGMNIESGGGDTGGGDNNGDEIKIDDMIWKDEYFSENPYEYKDNDQGKTTENLHNLATIAAKLSVDAYNPAKIESTLSMLHFTNIDAKNYDKVNDDPNNVKHIVAYTFANKKDVLIDGDEYNLIAIVVRGTPENCEWYSNFDVWQDENTPSSVHYGFNEAKKELYAALIRYLEDNALLDDTAKNKVLITGHSRGAAVANLLAATIDDDYSQTICDPNNLFAYTFAAPNVMRGGDILDEKYKNIINFVNAEDFVPYMPLVSGGWNYNRYGKTYVFPSKGVVEGCENLFYSKLNTAYKQIPDPNLPNSYPSEYHGYKKGFMPLQNAVRALCDDSLPPSKSIAFDVYDYYNKNVSRGPLSGSMKPVEFMKCLAEYKSHNASVDTWINLALSVSVGSLYPPIADFFLIHAALGAEFGEAHDSRLYLAWMQVIGEAKAYSYLGTKQLGIHVRIACPVDVEVYNSQNILVGKVTNNIIDETINGDIAIFIDEDIKHIYLPSYDTYTFKLLGSDDGTMDYNISSVNIASALLEQIKEFHDVNLYDGKEMISFVSGEIDTPDVKLLVVSGGKSIAEILEDGTEIPIKTSPTTPTTPPSDNTTPTPDSKPWNNPFIDVKSSDWFYGDVEYVYTNDLMNGTTSNTFSPYLELTRGMIVTVLYRQAGNPDVSSMINPFIDVADGQYYANAVKWAAKNEIVKGIGNNKYAPNTPISRQDLAVILMRYAEYINKELPITRPYETFLDEANIANYAKSAIEIFFRAGIINGKNGNLFDPKGTATRAEVAAMLHRFLETIDI